MKHQLVTYGNIMNKSTDFAISTQKIIIGFQNTVKRFSSEYDFNQ